jgi:hypothetical protein
MQERLQQFEEMQAEKVKLQKAKNKMLETMEALIDIIES